MTHVNTDAAITKVAQRERYRRPFRAYPSAREAMGAFLRAVNVRKDQRVLLPAYIGWSAREGSGVFDPVRETEVGFGFYALGDRLEIDLTDLESELAKGDVRLVVLIHYFGRPDPRWEEAVALARRYDALVLEDSAHAMLTDIVAGACGRAGDASFYSLHKLLPIHDGGMLVLNPWAPITLADIPGEDLPADAPWTFDLQRIAAIRMRNARLLHDLIANEPRLRGELSPLWESFPDHCVLQTYPVMIHRVSRDQLYFSMNEAGYGVVSLYHTMIDQLHVDAYPSSHFVAQRVMNLPVHQDVTEQQLHALVETLAVQIAAAATRTP